MTIHNILAILVPIVLVVGFYAVMRATEARIRRERGQKNVAAK